MKNYYLNVNTSFICFSATTLIALSDGTDKEIEKINVGESILGWDVNTERATSVIVDVVASSFHMQYMTLSFDDGTTLSCTDDHPLWVEGKGWCVIDPAKAKRNYGLVTRQLMNGDRLCALRGGLLTNVKLTDVEKVTKSSRMWIIGTGNNHTFFANGILAHDEDVSNLELSAIPNVTIKRLDQQLSEAAIL